MKAYTYETTQRAASSSNTSVGAYYNDPDEMIVTNTQVVVMDVIINNLDEGEHPFHLHGFTPFLVGSGAGNFQGGANFSDARVNPMRRDVFSVPPFSWMAFRFVADNAGHLGRSTATSCRICRRPADAVPGAAGPDRQLARHGAVLPTVLGRVQLGLAESEFAHVDGRSEQHVALYPLQPLFSLFTSLVERIAEPFKASLDSRMTCDLLRLRQ